jgi:hypothetical protein
MSRENDAWAEERTRYQFLVRWRGRFRNGRGGRDLDASPKSDRRTRKKVHGHVPEAKAPANQRPELERASGRATP